MAVSWTIKDKSQAPAYRAPEGGRAIDSGWNFRSLTISSIESLRASGYVPERTALESEYEGKRENWARNRRSGVSQLFKRFGLTSDGRLS